MKKIMLKFVLVIAGFAVISCSDTKKAFNLNGVGYISVYRSLLSIITTYSLTFSDATFSLTLFGKW